MNIDDAIKYFGSVRELAKELDVSTQRIYQVKAAGVMPEILRLKINELTGGKLNGKRDTPKAVRSKPSQRRAS